MMPVIPAPATITSTSFSSIISQAILNSATNVTTIRRLLNFDDVSALLSFEGSYTPSDEFITLNTPLWGQDVAPNFVIALADKPLNINYTYNDNTGIFIPQFYPLHVHLMPLAPINPRFITNINLDGRLSYNPIPMQQGVLVNYQIITGRATIT